MRAPLLKKVKFGVTWEGFLDKISVQITEGIFEKVPGRFLGQLLPEFIRKFSKEL